MKTVKIMMLVLALAANAFLARAFAELPPRSNKLVNDYAGLLTNAQVQKLEQKLVAFNDSNSTQITVLIVPDLQGYEISDYAQQVAQKWGVGQQKYDNGVIIVLKPKTAESRGDVTINVGYGIEPIIPDITAKRIIENEMIPRFRQDDYDGGLNAATDIIISLTAGKFTADEYNQRTGDTSGFGNLVPFLALIIIIVAISRGRGNNRTMGGGKRNTSLWTALWLGSMLGSSGSSWGNFRSGGGSFGGGGGGGFGGFGGGSFGGGGASGSW